MDSLTPTTLVTALGAFLGRTRRRFVIVLAFLAVFAQPLPAEAAWSASSTGSASVTATGVLRAGAPTAIRSGSTVQLSWPATTLGTGRAVEAYQVLRHEGSATPVLVCTTVAPTRTCDDASPSTNTVDYGVVAVFKSWRGQESPLTSYTPDLTRPVTTASTSPAPNAAGWNNGPVTVTLNATDASGVASIAYRINGGSPVSTVGSSVSVPVNAEGSTTVTYWATDVPGNVETQKTHVVRIDTVAPTTVPAGLAISPDTGSSGTDGITNQASQTFSGTAPAGSLVNVRLGASLVATVTASAGGTFTTTLPTLAGDGLHTVTARVVDPAGNEGPAASFTIRLDTIAPTTVPGGLAISADTGASATDGITNQAAQTLSGTAPAGSVVNVRVGASLVATVTASAGGTFTTTLPALSTDGLHTVTARVVDPAGNEGAAGSFSIGLDRTAPTGAIAFPAANGNYGGPQGREGCNVAPWNVQYAICGTATDSAFSAGMPATGSFRLVRADGLCWKGLGAGGAPTFDSASCTTQPTVTLTGATNLSWSRVVGDLPRSSFSLTVTLQDLAGNQTQIGPITYSLR